MINKAHIAVLVQKFADGNISREEYSELISYFNLSGNENDVEQGIYAAMDEVWKNTQADLSYTKAEADNFYKNIIERKAFKPNAAKVTLKPWYRYAAAAAILIIVGLGLYLYNNTTLAPASVRFATQDITPGGNKAILTLANGKKVELAANGIYTVKDVKGENEFNTITTPRGGQYQINLPDGSSVWLNASTSLTFPVHFSKAERVVVLNGEAYFEIEKVYEAAHSKRLPFIVKTAQQRVEVLGTHFNIKGYADEANTKTTLLEGSVKVGYLNDTRSEVQLRDLILKPGQQSILNQTSINVTIADMDETLAWKNGLFMFSGQDLESIMKQVSRWYDVEVAFENEAVKRQTFKGAISRFKNISQLLEVLESTGSVHFKMEGRRITAMQ
ncbi:DUF4974 domain-containing protein [Pedobacter sp. MC2016-14]|uniref:FecR family protein n=1 Tax=Pedobacter sp. MC2016-14 TaxID=2897327 RepID=UPI001E59DFCB|nr:FecR domain-containing protein [Pedobacter sp. MC2016-14]MCD0488357.1 DUF4974 domain-containing protein [Pedobacter sp. MC2016-14]